MQACAPLVEGSLIGARFEVCGVLGQGSFGITYLVNDLDRGDKAVAKELAPSGATRQEDQSVCFDRLGPAQAERLRYQFLREARLLMRLRCPGVLPCRAFLHDLGTSYAITEYVTGSMSLQRKMLQEGRFDADSTYQVLGGVLDALEALHDRGILHRDLKPSNILLGPDGAVYLIDFGLAREWIADLTMVHTVQFTPGYAPLEQLTEQGRRGPATDLYALSATAYHMVTGMAPPASSARAGGEPLPPVRSVRPDLDPRLAEAIEAGLRLPIHERPQTVAEYRQLLAGTAGESRTQPHLTELDDKVVELRRLRVEPRRCPWCGELLEEPKPLRRGVCPVCHDGSIRPRKVVDDVCPVCRMTALRQVRNSDPPRTCPKCRVGLLRSNGWMGRSRRVTCRQCGSEYERSGSEWVHLATGESRSWQAWREGASRSEVVWLCRECEAQFDELGDGRRRMVHPPPGEYTSLFPSEWSRIAAGLDPGAGNAFCEACDADYYVEGDYLTLLSADRDPFGFAEENLGRLLSLEAVRWLGVGKTSGDPGLLCSGCGAEFDFDGEALRLARCDAPNARQYCGATHSMENWYRLARDLPLVGEEHLLLAELDRALEEAFCVGELALDSRNPGSLWQGPARKLEPEGDQLRAGTSGRLVIRNGELVFGGLVRKTRLPLAEIADVTAEDGVLKCSLASGHDPLQLAIEPLRLQVELRSGQRQVKLEARHLAARLRFELRRPAEV
jgi:serine/threonine protein kinase